MSTWSIKPWLIFTFWFCVGAANAVTFTIPMQEWAEVQADALELDFTCMVEEERVILSPRCLQLQMEISRFRVKYDMDRIY